MFSYKSKLFLNNKIFTKLLINSKYKAPSFQVINICKKYFNKPTGDVTPANTQAPPKTKEQLKVEKLMENWPESVRNPQTEEMKLLKDSIEYLYKFHQGDKPYLKYHELPESITRSLNSQIYLSRSTENIAGIFRDMNGFIPDEMIAYKFYEICITHKDLTREFYETILPEMKKCIKNSDRQCINILAVAAIAGASAHIADLEFWGLLVKIIIFLNLE